MKYLFIMSLFFIFCVACLADEAWTPVSGIKDPDIKEIMASPCEKGVMYASASKTLHISKDMGKTWSSVFSTSGDANIINFIGASEGGVFVCTERGLFRSRDGISNWKRIFKGLISEENNVLCIAFLDDNIYIGTGGGLFISNDSGATWKKDTGEAGNISIKWISFLDNEILLVTENGVYIGRDSKWKRIFVSYTEEAEFDGDSTDSSAVASRPINSAFVDKKRSFLATDYGIFLSEDKGLSWKRFPSQGLFSQKVKRLLSDDALFAATDKGVFVFNDENEIWVSLYKGMSASKVRSLSIDNAKLWAATDKGLYRTDLKNAVLFSEKDRLDFEKNNIIGRFENEPAIREVQELAIKYAEVHPEKIKEWRSAASKKALLPDLSVGLDRYVTDYYHWDAGQNPDVLVKGDDVVSWDVTMAWDLGELVWNDDQTSIDTRSRLMVQLRDDILDEITRTYFERRRLQIETHLSPPKDLRKELEIDLRIQELTADLDALTGGYFSKQIKP